MSKHKHDRQGGAIFQNPELDDLFGEEIESEDDGAGAAAASYTDEFFAAAVAKIDATFGEGYARQNPALVGDYLKASASNLSAFMQSAMAMAQFGAMEAPSRRRRG